MGPEAFEILTHDKIRELIEANLDADSADFALRHSHNDFPAALVSSQIKYLQKSRNKLPSFYSARCIIPPRAYEQASSEISAQMKKYKGASCLDLTCGLGVDSYYFAQNFDQVTAVEPDPILSQIVAYNFSLLGTDNIRFLQTTAEVYLNSLDGQIYDLVYVDPDRRDKAGKRRFAMEDCQPDVGKLLPELLRVARTLLIKISPMFDIAEALKVFPYVTAIFVISIKNECKELLVEIKPSAAEGYIPELRLMLYRNGHKKSYNFLLTPSHVNAEILPTEGGAQYIWEADVAFYKGRCFRQLIANYFSAYSGSLNHSTGFFFSFGKLPPDFPGKIFKILHTFAYKPAQIKKELKRRGIRKIQIIQRYFPVSGKIIRKQLNMQDGGKHFLICTRIGDQKRAFLAHLTDPASIVH